ncbi:transposase, partial [Klebsiella pneumoniae]
QRMAEYLVLYNSKRPHKSLELMTPVDYILRESKNCNMWWTHTNSTFIKITSNQYLIVLLSLYLAI